MIPYLGCEIARDMLEGFTDGELPLDDQVAVESHLRWCRTCLARVEDLRLIGASLRVRSVNLADHTRELSALESAQAEVVSRIRIERDQSLGVWVRALFQDMRFFWPALGATAAVTVCLVGAVGVLYAAADKHPHSMAGTIQYLADPGSDCYPLTLDARISVPRALNIGPALDLIPEDEAAFALATTVTREGRISSYELRFTYGLDRPTDVAQAGGTTDRPQETPARVDDLQAILDAVKSARFEPAQGADGGAVAVNMVWLVARTTVRARPLDFDTRSIEPVPPPARVAKPADSKPAAELRRSPRSTTA